MLKARTSSEDSGETQMAKARLINGAKKRLVLSVGAGVIAAFLMYLYAGNLEAQANSTYSAALDEYGGSRVEVLVATRDIRAGEELSAENTTMMPWLSELLPQGALTSPEDAYGKTLSQPVWKNEPLTAVRMGSGEEMIRVPDGLSAVSIPISDDMAVGGSLLPGSSVDVYAIGANQVRLVAADALVLEASNGVGNALTARDAAQTGTVLGGSSRAALRWVTLAVLDETVRELLSAARDNTLSIVLPGQNAGGALALSATAHSEDQESVAEGSESQESAATESEARELPATEAGVREQAANSEGRNR